MLGGAGGAAGALAGTGGTAGQPSADPHAPREGSFKVLVCSITKGIRPSGIANGQQMLTELAAEYGFELTLTEDHADFTALKLSEYELIFFLNTSGDILNEAEQRAFETWMVENDGAFAATSSAVDTEQNWRFYTELTGEYYDGHSPCCPEQDIVWEPDALEFPAVRGLPSPWRRGALWRLFDEFSIWRDKPGFQVLATTELEGTTVPVSFVREWENFRSFYTALGYEATSFDDVNVRRHIAAGLLWTVRRAHWLE
jgi:type 1 glutamine amidotransferase